MTGLLAISKCIDQLSRAVGVIATWLVLFAALLSALNALVRYSLTGVMALDRELRVFGGGLGWLLDAYRDHSNVMGEAQLVMFSGMVMLGAPWTLKMNEHVRVDVLYGWAAPRTRLWIDLAGGVLFLLPAAALMIYFAWPWFYESWVTNEMSSNAGGLPRWPFKIFLPLGFALIGLQGISEIIKCVAALKHAPVEIRAYEKPVQ